MFFVSIESLIPIYKELCFEENIQVNSKIVSYLDRKVVEPYIFWLTKYDKNAQRKSCGSNHQHQEYWSGGCADRPGDLIAQGVTAVPG